MRKFNIINYEGKTEEEALDKCIKKENCSREDFIYKVTCVKGNLIKKKKYIISVLKKQEIIDFIKEYFEILGQQMNISIKPSVTIENDNFNIDLVSDNNSVLIGKNGKNLNALQTMIRQVFHVQLNMNAKINVDISNYRFDKLKRLDKQIENIINEVLESKMDIYLDPMNAYERRYVHNLVNKYEHVKTQSVGEGLERRVVIKYDNE